VQDANRAFSRKEFQGYQRARLVSGRPVHLLSDGIDGRSGSTAAIHCWRTTCNDLAKCTKGAFQSIEEIAAQRSIDFAEEWDDGVHDAQLRSKALRSLTRDAMTQATIDPQQGHDHGLDVALQVAWVTLAHSGLAMDALEVLKLERGHLTVRLLRCMRCLGLGHGHNQPPLYDT